MHNSLARTAATLVSTLGAVIALSGFSPLAAHAQSFPPNPATQPQRSPQTNSTQENSAQKLILDLPEEIVLPSTLQRPTVRFTMTQPQMFKVGDNPSVQIATIVNSTKPLACKIEQLGSKGACQLVFEDGIPEGSYTVAVSTRATPSSPKETAYCRIESQPAAFGADFEQAFNAFQPEFGERFTLKTALPFPSKPLAPYLFYAISLGQDQAEETPYTEEFRSPMIPGIARTVALSLVWKHPQTGEKLVLLRRRTDTEQKKPTIYGNPILESAPTAKSAKASNKAAQMGKLKPNETEFLIKNILVSFAIPVDADERQSPPVQILAQSTDLEITDIALDLKHPQTSLRLFKNGIPEPESTYRADETTLQAAGTAEVAPRWLHVITTVRLKKLPIFADRLPRSLMGMLMVRVSAKLTNRKAAKTVTNDALVPVPIRIDLQ
jgi:hypothetical protein